MNIALCAVFFASGVSALLFETLWFRQAGLMLGNSIWATSLVTSSFMGGLAIGNLVAGARGERLAKPLRVYAGLEAAIGASGLGLVMLLPNLAVALAPVLRPFLGHPESLNAVRFLSAFALLLIPATAMGITLPILASALSRRDPRFGRVLGLLYGLNTLGAVAGALLGEGFLIAQFGIKGTGLVAAAVNAAAVVTALVIGRRWPESGSGRESEVAERAPGDFSGARLLAAALLSGGLLLALEVVWFRLLLMFVFGTSLSFAVMLAIVLFGIGAGGLVSGLIVKADDDARKWLPAVALAAGALTAWTYAALPQTLERYLDLPAFFNPRDVFNVAWPLMLPTSLLSGMLFTLMGVAVKANGRNASGAAGFVACANTIGAMIGPLIVTFILLPALGIEATVFALASGYGAVAILCAGPRSLAPAAPSTWRRVALGTAALAFIGTIALFPFGLMKSRFARWPMRPYLAEGVRVGGYREGLTETITYLVSNHWGEDTSYRLLTNSYSMSGSGPMSARYMRFFVNWPVAVHPDPRQALLISYGVGITAKALVETQGLESIDVVDISKDILEMGRIVFPRPGSFPLDDPRVRVHVEDGRFFLLTTDQTFDIITAEPPPPKGSGVVNLYSREYFKLIRKRLKPGGISTYWLPVYQLDGPEAKAIIRGFCDAFEDCSLWTGAGLEWMLVGTNNVSAPVSVERFARQWNNQAARAALGDIGFEGPELVGAAFLADSATLQALTASTPPLDDDHPLRISPAPSLSLDPFYFELMDAGRARGRFDSSAAMRRLWPAALFEPTLKAFSEQYWINRGHMLAYGQPRLADNEIEALLTLSRRRAPVLAAMNVSDRAIEAARHADQRGVDDPLIDEMLGVDALADRDFVRAADRLRRAERGGRATIVHPLREMAERLTPEPAKR